MIQANSTLIEGKSVSRIGKLVKSDEGLTSDKPDGASKWTGLFVQDQLGVEEPLVPQDTAVEIANGQSHMGDCHKFGHVSLLIGPTRDDRKADDSVTGAIISSRSSGHLCAPSPTSLPGSSSRARIPLEVVAVSKARED